MNSKSSRPTPLRLMFALSVIVAGHALANDRHFGYLYETATMPVGAREIEVWSTASVGRENYYSRLDHSLEFETGLTDNLQGSLYLNWRNTTADTGAGNRVNTFEWKGLSTELKYKLSDPSVDPVGFALYGELGYNTDEIEVEAKAILDKRLGPWLLAANFAGEFEYEAEGTELELEEIGMEGVLGASYALSPRLALGVEMRSHNEIVKTAEEMEFESSALYLGPTVAWSSKSWWMTFTVLPQVVAFKHEGGGMRDLEDHEAVQARLLLSMHL
jgi:hypothetical protein